MANTLGIDYAADAGEMMDDSGQTCVVAGTTAAVDCIAGAETRAFEVDDENDVVSYEREVLVKIADLTSTPAMKAKVTIDSVQYALVDYMKDISDGILRMIVRRNQDH